MTREQKIMLVAIPPVAAPFLFGALVMALCRFLGVELAQEGRAFIAFFSVAIAIIGGLIWVLSIVETFGGLREILKADEATDEVERG